MRAQNEEISFEQVREIGASLATLSSIEFAIILVATIFQVVLLRSFLVKRNYI